MRIAHISDIHLFCGHCIRHENILNKRLIGLANWYLRRRRKMDFRILDLLSEKMKELEPKVLCITGDIVHLGFREEFERARKWLEGLRSICPVKIVPGNHDAYLPECIPRLKKTFGDFFSIKGSEISGKAPLEDIFPVVDVDEKSGVALIGLSTATPTGLIHATGSLGEGQIQRLGGALKDLGRKGLLRVILIHHPPIHGCVSKRRSLIDLDGLEKLVDKTGAEVFLFGHSHKRLVSPSNGNLSKRIYLNAPSITSISKDPVKRAGFFLIDIHRNGSTWNVTCKDFILGGKQGFFYFRKRPLLEPFSIKRLPRKKPNPT